MFKSNALPPPASFGREHRPLRLTSESARPHPQGGCHFQPIPGQSQRCMCQSFEHNRSAPGNVCDCGHSACYHSQSNHERRISPDRIVSALAEKVKKLEDAIVKERETRDNLFARERQAWEREVRVLREALAPFYRSEQDMTRRLLDVEDKIDATRESQSRLKDKLSAMDDANIIFNQTSDSAEAIRSRKRKASLTRECPELISPEPNETSSNSDATSVSQISPQSTSPVNDHLLVDDVSTHGQPPNETYNKNPLSKIMSAPGTLHHYHHQKQQLPSPESEPRSSGFLSIDLTERVRRHKSSPPSRPKRELPIIPSINRGLPSPPHYHGKAVTGMLPVSELLSNVGCRPADGPESRSLKKRKQQNGVMALDVLANVTVASPLAH